MEPQSEVVSNHLSDHNFGNVVSDEEQAAEMNGNTTLLSGKDKENNALDYELSCLDESPDEQNKAPMEVLAEFLSALMSREYKAALGYCQQILQYEPSNKTALEFYPLIQQKIRLDQSKLFALSLERRSSASSLGKSRSQKAAESKITEYSSEEESGGSASVDESENKGSESSEYYSSAESGSENLATRSVSSSEDEDSSCPAVSE